MARASQQFEWCIIGAGPAGIATVGKLIDFGCDPATILWIDPEFSVGDFGTKWHNVASNTKVRLFKYFMHSCDSFGYDNLGQNFDIDKLASETTCRLGTVAEPLQSITHRLQQTVLSVRDYVRYLDMNDQSWRLHTDKQTTPYHAEKVVLAVGAEPKHLDYGGPAQTVTLTEALDEKRLPEAVGSNDTVAVFGSSHSSIMAISHLVNLGIKRIINFYRSPLKYAVDMGDWILYDNTGLKGSTARWAKQNLHGTLPDNLERYHCHDISIDDYLAQCDKIIAGIGFNTRQSVQVQGFNKLEHDSNTGIIAPGLFGTGIAFPKYHIDPMDIGEYRVGLKKFVDDLDKIIPLWINYPGS